MHGCLTPAGLALEPLPAANDARMWTRTKSSGTLKLTAIRRLKYTRAILDAIHTGELAKAEFEIYETFNLHVPKVCTNVPSELLNPAKSWNGKTDFKEEVMKLGGLFVQNFKKYSDEATPEVIKAGKSCAESYRFGQD